MTAGRAAGAALVVLMHALLLLWWRPTALPPTSAPPGRLVVRLVPNTEAVAVPDTQRIEPDSERSSPRPREPVSAPVRPDAGAGPERATADSRPPQTAAVSPVDSAASSPTSRPLDLTVRADPRPPPPAAAALSDPRANRRRPSMGEVLAQRLGADDRRYEEIRPDGSVRIRQGTLCLDARASRAAELDPFRAAERPSPRQISACD